MHHDLKTWPMYFNAVVCGIKTFEIRENDMNFQAGDTVTLHEYEPEFKEPLEPDEASYTGRSYSAEIGYVTDFAQQPGYVVFSLVNQEDK